MRRISHWLGALGIAASATAYGQQSEPAAAPLPATAEAAPAPHGVPATAAAVAPPAAVPGCETCGTGFDFKNVPPAPRTPVARAGMFTVPPKGCGYYSVLDHLTGELRDAAPKYPYPAFTTSTLSFFDADWRFVDDPKYTPDSLEKLKRMRVGDNFLVSTGGQTWVRYANEWNSRATANNDTYTLYRVRPYLDVWYQDKFRFFAEFIAADSFNEDLPPLTSDADRADFQNLFLEAKLLDVMGKPVYGRVGRQEIQFGSQRLVATPDWANTRRTFDGARVSRVGEKWDFDAFWAQPVIDNNRNGLNSHDNNQNFAGAWATYKVRKGTGVDLYYLMLDNTNSVTQQGVKRAPFTAHTLGGRFAGDVDDTYLWDVEGAVQLGNRGGENIAAGMFTAGLGYHAKDLPWNPVLWGYYDYASGDHNVNGGSYNTFNQMFPFGHYYFGWIDFVGRQNIHDLNASLHLYPAKWLTVWTQYHMFYLDSATDALYNVGGNAIRRDPTGRAGHHVGNELDLILNFHLTKRADMLTGYSYFFAGDFVNNTAGTAGGKDASLFYLSYSYRW